MQTLATYNFKGGVGKTATAVNVSRLAARDGLRVLLWDLDPQGAATFTLRVKTEFKGGGEELVRGHGLAEGVRASDYEGLDVLPSDFSFRHLDVLLREREFEVLAGLVDGFSAEYDLIVLDCAPTLSSVTENVFTASDCVLAPTIPTALSLRTLSRFMQHLKKRSGKRPRVLPFFCMVDRRKALHRRVCDWAFEQELGFLATEIPYSSAVEQMSVRRMPLSEFARSDRAARAYEALWVEVRQRMAQPRSQDPTRDALESLYERALERRDPAMTTREIEFKLALADQAELDALAAAAERRGARRLGPVDQENHFFDTPKGELRARGLVVRLRREENRYVLSVKGPRAPDGEADVHDRPEHEADVGEERGQRILEQGVVGIDMLEDWLSSSGPEIVGQVREAAGQSHDLMHVGSFRNRRLRLGPLHAASAGELVLELDRTELPGGRVDHEVELEVGASSREEGRRLLDELLAEAHIVARPATSKARRFFEALRAGGGAG